MGCGCRLTSVRLGNYNLPVSTVTVQRGKYDSFTKLVDALVYARYRVFVSQHYAIQSSVVDTEVY